MDSYELEHQKVWYAETPNSDFVYSEANHMLEQFMEQQREPVELYSDDDSIVDMLNEAISMLTDKQQAVVKLYLAGTKQVDIADELGISQGAVTMTLNGCYAYRDKRGNILPQPIRYGGAISRLKTLMEDIKDLEKIKKSGKNPKEYKRCVGCGKMLHLSMFGRHKITADGYTARCKSCRS